MKCDISEQNNIFYRHEGKKTFIFDWLKSKSTFSSSKNIYKFQ
jgi:hypothetical protein